MNVDSVVRPKVDLRRTFHFDTRIHPEVRGLLTSFQSANPHQYVSVRLKWETGSSFNYLHYNTLITFTITPQLPMHPLRWPTYTNLLRNLFQAHFSWMFENGYFLRLKYSSILPNTIITLFNSTAILSSLAGHYTRLTTFRPSCLLLFLSQ